MIAGFPEYTDSFLQGQDLMYAQFNDIEFYVEDTEQENMYFNILKRVFPGMKFEKIFPLNGKKNVRDGAFVNQGNRKKVYILDLDYDHILNRIEVQDNLFYLKKYSIENYLISKEAIYESIKFRHPTLKNSEIDSRLNFNLLLAHAVHCLKELACCFIIIQDKELGHPYYGLNVRRDFDFRTNPPSYTNNYINDYMAEVEVVLRAKDARYSIKGQLKKVKKYFKTLLDSLDNIPGKYILIFLKDRLHAQGLIHQTSLDSFVYSLSKEVNISDFAYLRTRISAYVNHK